MGLMKRAAAKKIKVKNPFPLPDTPKGKKEAKKQLKELKGKVKKKTGKKPTLKVVEKKPANKPVKKQEKGFMGWESVTGQKDIYSDPVAIQSLMDDVSPEIDKLSNEIMSIRVKRGKLFAKLLDGFGGRFDPFWKAVEGKAGPWKVNKGQIKQEIVLWQFCLSFPDDDREVMEMVTFAALSYFRNTFKDSEMRSVLEGLKKRKKRLDAKLRNEDPVKKQAIIVAEIKSLAAGYKKRDEKQKKKQEEVTKAKEAGKEPQVEVNTGDDEDTDDTVTADTTGTMSANRGDPDDEVTYTNLVKLAKHSKEFFENYMKNHPVGKSLCSMDNLEYTFQVFCDLDKEVKGVLDRLSRMRDAIKAAKVREKAQRIRG